LTEDEKKMLLKVARESILNHLKSGENIDYSEISFGFLKEKRGVFVSLHKKGQLRGCIGRLIPDKPLINLVSEMAIASAFSDPRFSGVQEREMKDIQIEISVLSPLKEIDNYKEIEIGKHGVLMKHQGKSGVFLPQVAPEQGWNRIEMLEYLCLHKAGIPKDSYKKGANLFIFTAEVFSE
jgi:AmmeMemoRadiSam system protein A